MTTPSSNPDEKTSSPSPSPPPAAPTSSTPGVRATAFQKLHHDALSSTLKAISYESFAACFPLIAAQAPGSLRAMHGNFVSRLEGFAQEEFKQILLERNVIPNLNTLDSLISDAKLRKSQALPPHSVSSTNSTSNHPDLANSTNTPPPHTLAPTTILQAHLKPVQNSQQSQLNAKLQTVESQNAELVRRVVEQRGEIEGLMGVLEGVVGDLERARGELAGDAEELSGKGREVEGVLRG